MLRVYGRFFKFWNSYIGVPDLIYRLLRDFDPLAVRTYVPGTGTPVIGGLILILPEILSNLGGLNIVGADVVEVSPILDVASMTQIVGSTIALDLLHLL